MKPMASAVHLSRLAVSRVTAATIARHYATAAPTTAKLSAAQPIGQRRFRLPVETDPHKLVNYCCGANYAKDGEPIKLKPDSEYPDWIWQLRLRLPAPIAELDPNTKEYWEEVARVGQIIQYRQIGVWKKRTKIVSETLIKQEELKYRRRVRALSKQHGFDAGYEISAEHERRDNLFYSYIQKREMYRLEDETEPFYPGVDEVDVPYDIDNCLYFRKGVKKVGRFGL